MAIDLNRLSTFEALLPSVTTKSTTMASANLSSYAKNRPQIWLILTNKLVLMVLRQPYLKVNTDFASITVRFKEDETNSAAAENF